MKRSLLSERMHLHVPMEKQIRVIVDSDVAMRRMIRSQSPISF